MKLASERPSKPACLSIKILLIIRGTTKWRLLFHLTWRNSGARNWQRSSSSMRRSRSTLYRSRIYSAENSPRVSAGWLSTKRIERLHQRFGSPTQTNSFTRSSRQWRGGPVAFFSFRVHQYCTRRQDSSRCCTCSTPMHIHSLILESVQEGASERQLLVRDALMDLSDDASVLFAEEALNRLGTSFASDGQLVQLCTHVRQTLDDEIGSAARTGSLRALREHLSETYKLHRRLLRTRRADPRVSISCHSEPA